MLGHSAISQLPISTSTQVFAIIEIQGKPLVWILDRRTNTWQIKELKDEWVVFKRKEWTVGRKAKDWNISKQSMWYKNN